MPRWLAKQPNGRYCLFSTVVDAITVYDMTVENVHRHYMGDSETARIMLERADGEVELYAYDGPHQGDLFRWNEIKQMINYEESPEQIEVVKQCERVIINP